MKTLNKIISEKRANEEMEILIEVYEEMAAMKLQKIREDIEISRDYFQALAQLAREVGADLSHYKGKTGKKAAVFLSANEGLYGDIIRKIFDNFVTNAIKGQMDLFVIGARGKEMMETYFPKTQYKYFDFPDEDLNWDVFSILAKELLDYEQIDVYFGKFKNIATQDASTEILSGDLLSEYFDSSRKTGKGEIINRIMEMILGGFAPDEAKDQIKPGGEYIYEPGISEISTKFGKEILTSIFEENIRETQLAKYGARLMMLDESLDRVQLYTEKLSVSVRKASKMLEGKKQRARVVRIMKSPAW